ncbi:MAG: PEP-CTERM sorting domain-containing protein [Cyanobacteria bacterium P01_F01_bin.56]
MNKTYLAAASIGLLAAFAPVAPAFGATMSVTSDPSQNYQYLDDPVSQARLFSAPPNLGTGNAAAPGGGRWNGYMVFELPDLLGETLTSASLDFSAFIDASVNAPVNINADIWGVGFTTGFAPILENYDGDDANDGNPGNVRIQDNILTPSSLVGVGNRTSISTDATGDANLLAYLNTFYDANPGYTGGSFAHLRLNHDAPASLGNKIERYIVDSNASDSPTLTLTTSTAEAVPEPASILGLAAMAGIGVVTRRKLAQSEEA